MALERLEYRDGDVALTGWLARPVRPPRAAVLVFPTIANVTHHIEHRAELLAEADYLAFIADFYGEPVTDFAASLPLAKALRADVGRYRARIGAALTTLQALIASPTMPIAAIGFCMGGQAVLELARSGAAISAVVSFHGALDTQAPAQPGVMKARMLICHGDADPLVPREQVRAFQEEMDHAGGDWHLHSYSGVRHGFTDFGSAARGMAALGYDASADHQSWAAMYRFFDEALA